MRARRKLAIYQTRPRKQKFVVYDIRSLLPKTYEDLNNKTPKPCPLRAIHTHLEALVTKDQLRLKDAKFKAQYLDLFPPEIPDITKLPDNVLMSVKLEQPETHGSMHIFLSKEISHKAGKHLYNNILQWVASAPPIVIIFP